MDKATDKSMRWFWERLDHYLAAKQLKQTKQRKLIIEYFITLPGHISAEELHDYIRSKGHQPGLATIYRTLNLLKEAGLVEQKQFAEGKAVFEVNLPNKHHDHLICMDCGLVREFENTKIEKLQEQVAEELQFELVSHTLDMYGRCKDKVACRKRAGTARK